MKAVSEVDLSRRDAAAVQHGLIGATRSKYAACIWRANLNHVIAPAAAEIICSRFAHIMSQD